MTFFRVTYRLTCGHKKANGVGTMNAHQRNTPTRKDGSFAATRCPHGCGRRRVILVHHSSVRNHW